jgi:molybdopterin-guanine dinucleotide biosynthesis protein MobB
MLNSIPIYSVVAYSGTGKTTLIEKLVAELKARGFRTAVIKHDAHEFDIDHEGKDSWRFTRAGADVTVVASESKAAVMENRPVSLDALLGMITDVDVILTEGYKSGAWPKIAMMRSATGKPLPIPADECFAVVTDAEEYLASGEMGASTDTRASSETGASAETPTPRFALDDARGLANLIIRDMHSAAR